MSPFSGLSTIGGGYGNGIDRDFSPILHYIDEFDRHFSRRHRFMNCFIPRFDLEEDAHNYYLYGDIPGASVNDTGKHRQDDVPLADITDSAIFFDARIDLPYNDRYPRYRAILLNYRLKRT
jgi:hypothetical protein